MALETKQGSDGFRKFSYKFKELVGVTYRDGTWVSTNEVSGYMEMVDHYVTILTMVPSYMVSCNENMSIKVGKWLPEEHPEKWMEYLSPDVTEQTQMKDLVIPGSHDSASFDLAREMEEQSTSLHTLNWPKKSSKDGLKHKT
ncbi:Hypothetical predicted protein [Mytilus galloprovincialis]|uniref:Uncharacterized protein n=1 Tax=Mytilus galloprovincialis TaxID=29158 RepID=A0A8B6BWV2_MYTGA|nr:Hypothetical predicted protein [Mytilus galloprovincialis]